jgi:hypothetical protein
MLRKTTETGMRQVVRPWAATGSVPVDVLVGWALIEQRAGNAMAGLNQVEAEAVGFQWQARTLSAAVAEIAELGCRPDVSGGGREVVHPAAEAVVAAIALLPEGERIVRAARQGPPNGWHAPTRWLVPERWEPDGERAMWCWGERRNVGAHCPLVRVACADTIAAARAEWLAWWDALAELGWRLGMRGLGFAVVGPSVVREPWGAGGVDAGLQLC